MSIQNPRVAVLGVRCPIHGPTTLKRANQGGVDLECGCSWAARGDEWEVFYYSKGWDALEEDAKKAGFTDGRNPQEINR